MMTMMMMKMMVSKRKNILTKHVHFLIVHSKSWMRVNTEIYLVVNKSFHLIKIKGPPFGISILIGNSLKETDISVSVVNQPHILRMLRKSSNIVILEETTQKRLKRNFDQLTLSMLRLLLSKAQELKNL